MFLSIAVQPLLYQLPDTYQVKRLSHIDNPRIDFVDFFYYVYIGIGRNQDNGYFRHTSVEAIPIKPFIFYDLQTERKGLAVLSSKTIYAYRNDKEGALIGGRRTKKIRRF
ncbi:MAG: hypothetical protein GX434_03330 [Peptococcaceae bacterium]|nr:hypothetical protein [Peptococcaceae bacterium]